VRAGRLIYSLRWFSVFNCIRHVAAYNFGNDLLVLTVLGQDGGFNGFEDLLGLTV